jgi:hypothetical protein
MSYASFVKARYIEAYLDGQPPHCEITLDEWMPLDRSSDEPHLTVAELEQQIQQWVNRTEKGAPCLNREIVVPTKLVASAPVRIKFLSMRQAASIALAGMLIFHAVSSNAVETASLNLDSLRMKCINFSEIKVGKSGADARECQVTEFGSVGNIDDENLTYAIYCLMPSYVDKDPKCGDGAFEANYYSWRRGGDFREAFQFKSGQSFV